MKERVSRSLALEKSRPLPETKGGGRANPPLSPKTRGPPLVSRKGGGFFQGKRPRNAFPHMFESLEVCAPRRASRHGCGYKSRTASPLAAHSKRPASRSRVRIWSRPGRAWSAVECPGAASRRRRLFADVVDSRSPALLVSTPASRSRFLSSRGRSGAGRIGPRAGLLRRRRGRRRGGRMRPGPRWRRRGGTWRRGSWGSRGTRVEGPKKNGVNLQ